MGSPQTSAMSLISQWTIDLPPTLIRGLGVVSVWGRMRFPIPAIGIINLILVAEGTGHAILCARECLKGDVIVAFADTLFKTEFNLDKTKDGVIWVHKVDNPSSFGVVKYNQDNIITDFVEKPEHFVSDLAIIGIYYFQDGENLKKELQYVIDNDIKDKGEYQLTSALENMKNKGIKC